jgi:hypothetical protein
MVADGLLNRIHVSDVINAFKKNMPIQTLFFDMWKTIWWFSSKTTRKHSHTLSAPWNNHGTTQDGVYFVVVDASLLLRWKVVYYVRCKYSTKCIIFLV